MGERQQHLYEFGPFRLDLREQALLRQGRPVALAPKDFEVLVALVRRGGGLVGKDELLKEVWPDAFVEEANISRRVYALRQALGENEAGRPYIETVPKRGYRLATGVREVSEGEAEVAVETLTRTRIVAEEEITVGEADYPEARQEPTLALPQPNVRRGRTVARRALFAALMTLFVGAAAVFFLTRHDRPSPLTERDDILLADFDNRTGDEVFDGVLKQALAVQLQQSPFLNILSEERVREALRYMGRPPGERVTREVAREICERQGVKAMLAGSITRLGSRYVLTLEAVDARSGDAIAREQEEAEGQEQVLSALGEASSRLREKLGESLQSIRKFDAPIEQATTSSLDAFKAFTAGEEQRLKGGYPESAVLFQHAVELDPNFALAYSKLASVYSNLREPTRAAENARRAFDLRARVTERERLYIAANYYSNVTGEQGPQIEALELLKHIYPREWQAWNNLILIHTETGEYEKALAEAREAFRLNPGSAGVRSNLGTALMNLNRFDEAEELMRQAVADKFDSVGVHLKLFRIAFIKGEGEPMQQQLDWAAQKTNDHAELVWQASVADFKGQRRTARELRERRNQFMKDRGNPEEVAESELNNVSRDALVGICGQVRQRVEAPLSVTRNKNTLSLAGLSLALCGDGDRAQPLIKELREMYPKRTEIIQVVLPTMQAAVDMNGANPAGAAQAMKNVIPYELSHNYWPAYIRGLAQLRAGDAAGAADAFQNILDHPGVSPISIRFPLAQLGLARAFALAGDTNRSRKAYEDFFALWKDADPDIPVLLEARREYERLSGRARPPSL